MEKEGIAQTKEEARVLKKAARKVGDGGKIVKKNQKQRKRRVRKNGGNLRV